MKPLIIIAGPTASGKSAAAVALSKRLQGSVISADSMQVYKGMDIGSAKITAQEMQGIDHYLVDIIEPTDPWNVVRFQEEAKNALDTIVSKGELPILCGGTGFYIQSLLYDIDFTETQEDTSYREELQKIADEQGPEVLYKMLEEVDPKEAEENHPNNVKRLIRALEFYKQTGQKISDHNEVQHEKEPAYDVCFFVLTMDRAKLYERIDKRVDLMVEQGLVEEVERLKAQGLTQNDVSMQGLGYRQILDYLDGSITLEDAVTEIKTQTRHFAKRQLTWFKREQARLDRLVWVDVDSYKDTNAMYDDLEAQIRAHYHH